MATHKAKVIGPFEVCGVKPGQTVTLDDEQVNVEALVSSRNVELIIEKPAPEKKPGQKKGDD